MPETPTRVYAQPQKAVFGAAVRAVQVAGHRLDNIDENSGLLNFSTQTGVLEGLVTKDDGQVMSFLIREDAPGRTRVDVTGQPRNRWQFGSDNSREDLAESLFDRMDALLAGAE